MNKRNSVLKYLWLHRSRVGYISWAPGEPNNGGRSNVPENCAILNTGSNKWNDFPCATKFNFVCKMRGGKQRVRLKDFKSDSSFGRLPYQLKSGSRMQLQYLTFRPGQPQVSFNRTVGELENIASHLHTSASCSPYWGGEILPYISCPQKPTLPNSN